LSNVTSLVLPVFNPGPAIDGAYRAVLNFLRQRQSAWEIVFVLDGCTDGTYERLALLIADQNDARIRLISYPENQGKGHAVRKGLLAACGRFRIFTDVDLAYGFDDILRIDEMLRRGAAVAVASRDHPESEIHAPSKLIPYISWRWMQSWCFSAIVRRLLPIQQRDTQAGLKGMTAAVAERVLPCTHCDGFGFDCELLTACRVFGVPVDEVPVGVHWSGRGSTTTWKTTLAMIVEILSIRRRWRNPPFDPQGCPVQAVSLLRRAA
jgi:dolichyl-phosphate beta-glucosyltransferase